MSETSNAALALLEKHLEAKASLHFAPTADGAACAYFSADATGRPAGTLCTYGMSETPMPLDGRAVDTDTARIELIAYLDPDTREVPADLVRWMQWASAFPRLQSPPTYLGWGHTIQMGSLFPGSSLSTLFFLSPLVRVDKGDIGSLGGEAVSFLWLTFLTDAEYALTKTKGAGPNAVLDLFSKNRHPLEFSPTRASYV